MHMSCDPIILSHLEGKKMDMGNMYIDVVNVSPCVQRAKAVTLFLTRARGKEREREKKKRKRNIGKDFDGLGW